MDLDVRVDGTQWEMIGEQNEHFTELNFTTYLSIWVQHSMKLLYFHFWCYHYYTATVLITD